MNQPMSLRRFALLLAMMLALFAWRSPVSPSGDFEEYTVMAVALASHGTPAIRIEDVDTARRLARADFAVAFQSLADGMRAGVETPRYGFQRGRGGDYFAIHFFGYPALAAVPLRLMQAAGEAPLKGFQAANLCFVFVLGLCLFRLFGSAAKAGAALILFMLCGGALYWNWTSPECMSAAALLSGLILFATGAPRIGGLLAGLAAMQNPPIILFAGFAPLMHALLHYQAGGGWRAALRGALRPAQLAGVALLVALALLPIAFSLWQFGVPSLIAKYSTAPALIGPSRLFSFFFDLNQGMLVGVAALLAALALWGWRGRGALLALMVAFTVALALPSLAALNWNSGASGMMRYAFWGAMPLLFVLLLRLRDCAQWPPALVLGVALGQLACLLAASSYSYLEMSPLARTVLEHAPGLYNPEPEIFHERARHADNPPDAASVTTYASGGVLRKTMFARANPEIATLLCGRGQMLAPANRVVDAREFSYINGPVLCAESNTPGAPIVSYTAKQFGADGAPQLREGWSKMEFGGGMWDGAWSDGKRSVMAVGVAPGQRPRWIAIAGHYSAGNSRTRVAVNGIDLGWQRLERGAVLALPPATRGAPQLLVALEHEAPTATPGDARRLAFFIEKVALH